MTRRAGIPFRQALAFWFRLGCISFGGPAGQIAVMHEELVVRRRWISERRFLHALNYCMLLPGPEAQQLATYIGWLMHRTWGGLVAGVLFVLPSLVLLLALSWIYMTWGEVGWVAAFFDGLKPAVVAIVAAAAWRIGRRILANGWLLAISAAAFLLIFVFNVPFPWIVAGAALAGWWGGRVLPGRFVPEPVRPRSAPQSEPAVIGDDTPSPADARFSWGRASIVVAAGLLLWAGTLGLAVAYQGADGILAGIGMFFTRVALVTFGGAYAVLPYVYQGAVEQYGWLTPLQMIDGLALGETTPGPLIMVVAFVGFVGAWTDAFVQGLSPLAAGVLGGIVATWFTFLPSFVFIFLGGPAVESTRDDLRFTAPLTGITAAVVGVILNLAAFFAWHVFWPGGAFARPDWVAIAVAIAAAVALLRFNVGIIPVILAAGLAGVGLAAI